MDFGLDVLGEDPHEAIVALFDGFPEVADIEARYNELLRALLLSLLLDEAGHSHS